MFAISQDAKKFMRKSSDKTRAASTLASEKATHVIKVGIASVIVVSLIVYGLGYIFNFNVNLEGIEPIVACGIFFTILGYVYARIIYRNNLIKEARNKKYHR